MTTKQQAMEALIRAHDAVAGLNAAGAYSDIVNDLRLALCALDRAVEPKPINVYAVVGTKHPPRATQPFGACYATREEAEAHVGTWPACEGLRVAHLVEVQTLAEHA